MEHFEVHDTPKVTETLQRAVANRGTTLGDLSLQEISKASNSHNTSAKFLPSLDLLTDETPTIAIQKASDDGARKTGNGPFSKLDSDNSKKIGIKEWTDAFYHADKNKDEVLTDAEFSKAFGNSRKAKDMLSFIDRNDDRQCTIEEWTAGFLNLESYQDQDFAIDQVEFGKVDSPARLVPKASEEEIEQAMKLVTNDGASAALVDEVKNALAKMPGEFVRSLIDNKTKISIKPDVPPGLPVGGGAYVSHDNEIHLYEKQINSSGVSVNQVLAVEMAHQWDHKVSKISGEQWFKDAYAQAKESGIPQDDNMLDNRREFIHHMVRYWTGDRSPGITDLMDYLGDDYKKRTAEALGVTV